MITEKELLEKVNNVLKEEGVDQNQDLQSSEIIEEFILPGLKASKDTLQAIYFQNHNRPGFLGKIKDFVQRKLINTTINVIEKQSMRQQKFNELTYRAIEKLAEENRGLREELDSLKKS
jgi:hypothetical protein